jgi:creatinine amidohydrolase/Fe(II)-dependent formamide hydrolase-like protein
MAGRTKVQEASKYLLRVIGKFPAKLAGNENHVTATILAGPDWDHLSMCGTITMTEPEWTNFVAALRRATPDDVELEDPAG